METPEKKMKTGLVIGKFYPPHRGHKFLIDSAVLGAKKVYIIVCFQKGESIPGKLRAKWIQEIHPQTEVILIKDTLSESLLNSTPEQISEAWAEHTLKILGRKPDVVYSSEEYGARYAKYMGSEHVLVDMKRKFVPVSGTAVRKNPLANWAYLEPPVRAHFIRKIAVLGAESTGTTTMAQALANHYKTAWVPEYGRIYAEAKLKSEDGNKWSTGEFIHIAKMQNKMEDALSRTADKLLICDTDSLATSLWHERYMGYISPEVEKLSRGRKYDLYLLTGAEIPFVQDGTRDGEHIRHAMHERFAEELKKRNKPFILLSGSREERLKKAIQACDKILTQG